MPKSQPIEIKRIQPPGRGQLLHGSRANRQIRPARPPHRIMNLMGLCGGWRLVAVLAVAGTAGGGAQVIPFESGGLRYQTLSREGVTVMFAHLPARLHDYEIIQVVVSNGSADKFTIRPEDFLFERPDGTRLYATGAKIVVDHLLSRATRGDVIKLISTYENSLNGVARFRSTNGFEARRQNYLAELGSSKVKAAAAASAIALIETRLDPGDSTDGAVFFASAAKPLGPGRLIVHAAGHVFEFNSEAPAPAKELQERPAPTH